MLSNSNIYFDKENRVGQQAQHKLGGGASKHHKGLGHAGSENAPPPGATPCKKGVRLPIFVSNSSRINQRDGPRGSLNENAVASAKGKGAGLSTYAGKPRTQRKKLGDISNRDQEQGGFGGFGDAGGSTKLVGGQTQTPGAGRLNGGSMTRANTGFAVSSDLQMTATRVGRPMLAERPLGGIVSRGDVPEVELAMGRLGDEEELLVQRRDEERTAAAMANAFRTSRQDRHTTRETRSRRPSYASPSPQSRSSALNTVVGLGAGHKSDRGSTRGAGAGLVGKGHTVDDDSLQRAIDKLISDDFEEIMGLKAGDTQQGLAFSANDDLLEDPGFLATDGGGIDPSPLSPLDDSFLSQDLDLSFAQN